MRSLIEEATCHAEEAGLFLLFALFATLLHTHVGQHLLSPPRHLLVLSQLSLVVTRYTLVALLDDSLLDKSLCLLEREVPILQLAKCLFDVLRPHVSAVAADHMEELPQLVKLSLDELVVDAVDDQVLQLAHTRHL